MRRSFLAIMAHAMDHAFGSQAPFRLGIEEELLLVDADTLALAHVASAVLPAVDAKRGEAKYDVYEALVETSTPVIGDAREGTLVLGELRGALRVAGATLIGAGIHPEGAFGDALHVDEPRYAEIGESMRGLLRRTPTAAVHVHVGMPDPESAITACNAMRAHLPLLQALAANSPWWHGQDSGFATARAQLFRGLPRGYIPRAFRDWEDYVAVVAEAVESAVVADYTYLWWDVRLHPALGTVELRAMDAQSRLGSVAGLSALVHGLVIAAVNGAGLAARAPSPEALAEASFRAGRDGLDATVWWNGSLRPVRGLATGALRVAHDHLADPSPLEEVERILRDGNGADRSRAAFERGGMPAMLAHLRNETREGAA